MTRAIPLLFLLLALPVAATAQAQAQSASTCSAIVEPEGILAPWSKPSNGKAAGSAAALGSARLVPGKAVSLTLLPTSQVDYPALPGRDDDSSSFGGLARFEIKAAGTYRIALGTPAWIDVTLGTYMVPSAAHSHGPDCTGIRKMVDFNLKPGLYTLQISDGAGSVAPVMLVQLP